MTIDPDSGAPRLDLHFAGRRQAWLACTAAWIAATLGSVPAHADAGSLVRCESPDGHVVYSNTGCPAGTRIKRTIEYAPALVVESPGEKPRPQEAGEAKETKEAKEAKEAQEAKVAREARETKEAKKAKEAKEAREARLAKEAAAKPVPRDVKPVRPDNPVAIDDAAKLSRARLPSPAPSKKSLCDELAGRIDQQEREVMAASEASRSDRILALRRLEAQRDSLCIDPAVIPPATGKSRDGGV